MMNKKVKLSHHSGINQNIDKETSVFVTKGWKVGKVEWSEKAILEAVKSYGIMPGILKNGSGERLNSNIENFENIMLDFDSPDATFNSMLEQVKQFKHPAFLFTSINHQKPKGNPPLVCDRFRILIPLDKSLNIEQFGRLVEYFKERFPTLDESIGLISRFYYVTDANLNYFHNPADASFLNPFSIIAEKGPEKQSGRPKEKNTFSKDQEIKLYDGTTSLVKNLNKKTKIFCPFCDPKKRKSPEKDNATIRKTKSGAYQIYCSSEEKVFWQDPAELDYSRDNLFFNIDTGTPMGKELGFLKSYIKQDDWLSFCNTSDINPACKTFLPRLQAGYNPKEEPGMDIKNKKYNFYEKSDLLNSVNGAKFQHINLDYLKNKTPYIWKILLNLFEDEDTLEHFLNWLKGVLDGNKPYTCWVITATPGSGKNLLYERVLMRLFKQSLIMNSSRMTDKFNLLLANLQLLGVDEVFIKNDLKGNMFRLNFLKNLTGSHETIIEPKGVNSFTVPSYMGIMMFSNNILSFPIEMKDRRFNVIQNPNSVELIDEPWWPQDGIEPFIEAELENFAIYMVSRDFNKTKFDSTIENFAKQNIQENTEEDVATFVRMLKDKDWDAFSFEEIFDEQFGITPETVEKDCKNLLGIPAKYMKKIMLSLLNSDRLSMKKRLKAIGMYETSTYTDGKTHKIYRAR